MAKSINPSVLSEQTSHDSFGVATQSAGTAEITLDNLADCLSNETIRQVAEEHEAGDERERKLTCTTFLWALVMCLARAKGVLRLIDIANQYVVHQTDPQRQSLSKEAVSENLRERPWQYVRGLVERLMSLNAGLFATALGQTCKKWISSIIIVDETLMPVAKALIDTYPGTRSSAENPRAVSKANVCMHPFSGLLDILRICKETDNRIDSSFLRPLGEPALYIFDKGYWWYNLFTEIIQRGQQFVTRLRLDAAITVEKVIEGDPAWIGQRLNLRQLGNFGHIDLVVRLGSQRNRMSFPLRLVGLPAEEGWHFWITNLMDPVLWPAARIADLYRLRWHIEILFRVLKSVLNIHRFVSTNENGFRFQIYAALLLYLLTRILILKAAQQAGLSPDDDLSMVYALKIVAAVLDKVSELVCIGATVDWEVLENRLITLILSQARRPNQKHKSQLAQFILSGAA
jgi:putative transposase